MSKALVIFHPDNQHPLNWMLNKRHRHVWISILDVDRCTWVSYDWAQGNPLIQFDAVADYDLETYWRSHGCTVVVTETGDAKPWGMWMLNNCVGHTKLILGIRSWAVTPHALYLSLTKQSLWDRAVEWVRQCTLVPGGSKPKMPPAVAPRGYRYVTQDAGTYTGTDPNSDVGGEITISSDRYNQIKSQQASFTVSQDEGDMGSARGQFQRPNDYIIQDGGEGGRVNPIYTGGGVNSLQSLNSFRKNTKQVLELIPGFTQAGPDTAPGFKNGPAGSGGDAPPAPPAPPPTPTQNAAAVSAAKRKKAPAKQTSAQARSGTSGTGGSSVATPTPGGDLSSASLTNKSLLG